MKLKEYKLYDKVVRRMWLDYDVRDYVKKKFGEGYEVVWFDGVPFFMNYCLKELIYDYDSNDSQKRIFEYFGEVK